MSQTLSIQIDGQICNKLYLSVDPSVHLCHTIHLSMSYNSFIYVIQSIYPAAHAAIYLAIHIPYIHTPYMCICTYIYIYIHIYTYVYLYTDGSSAAMAAAYLSMQLPTYRICTPHTCVYVHTYTHTHIFIYIYIQMHQVQLWMQ